MSAVEFVQVQAQLSVVLSSIARMAVKSLRPRWRMLLSRASPPVRTAHTMVHGRAWQVML